jgi:hypothetical protein
MVVTVVPAASGWAADAREFIVLPALVGSGWQ